MASGRSTSEPRTRVPARSAEAWPRPGRMTGGRDGWTRAHGVTTGSTSRVEWLTSLGGGHETSAREGHEQDREHHVRRRRRPPRPGDRSTARAVRDERLAATRGAPPMRAIRGRRATARTGQLRGHADRVAGRDGRQPELAGERGGRQNRRREPGDRGRRRLDGVVGRVDGPGEQLRQALEGDRDGEDEGHHRGLRRRRLRRRPHRRGRHGSRTGRGPAGRWRPRWTGTRSWRGSC